MATRKVSRRVDAGKPAMKTGTKRASAMRRIGDESSRTRAALLDAAEALMREEGYAAVTSRKVANRAGLTPQLVHYYFRTMDDLFLALWRRFVNKNVERQTRSWESPEPLRALWDVSRNLTDVVLESEFLAVAHHRKTVGQQVASDGDAYRKMQIEGIARLLPEYDLPDRDCSAEVVVMLLTSVSRTMALQKDLGMSVSHREVARYIDGWLERLEKHRARRRRTRAPAA